MMNDRILMMMVAWMLTMTPLPAHAAGDPEAGKQKAQVCASCHGADGNSSSPQFPRLAGQYPDYLMKALSDYKSGERKNAIMAGFAASLSPRDMEDLASFFASQKNGLFTKK